MTLEERVRRLEDKDDIRRLRHMYHYLINEDTYDGFRDIYTPDAVLRFDEHGTYNGVDEIINAFRIAGSQTSLIKQFIHNHMVEVDGDEASGIAYLEARYGRDGQSIRVAARYDEKYVRTPQGWRIKDTSIDVYYSVPHDQGWAGESGDYFSTQDYDFSGHKTG